MRTLNRFHVVALLMLAVVMPATAQPSDQRNAATWYERAIEQYEKLPKAQRDMLESYDPATGAPTPEVRAALVPVQSMLQNMQRGAAQEYSDFNLDFNQGFFLVMPHLNRLRNIAKIGRTDALVRLHDGDTAGAADRIASIYKMGGHGGDDRTLISSLVGQAVFNEADRAAQFGLDSAQFNAADSAKLLSATKQLGTDDPFNYLEGLAGEQEYTIDWIANTFTGEDAAARFAEQVSNFGDGTNAWMQIAALDEEQFAAALDEHDALLGQVIEIFAMPDSDAAKAELAEIEEKFERGEIGPVSRVMTPAFSKLMERKLEGEKRLAERIALYEKLATDQANPQDAANAAIWYLRAIELLEKLDSAKLDLIRSAAREKKAQPSAELQAALAEAQLAIDVFREASLIKRCDFSFARRSPDASKLIPAYLPGMHDGFLALHADAVQLLAAGKTDDAIDRITIAFRAGAHLGTDPMLISSLIAHHQFLTTFHFIESAFLKGTLSPDSKPQILDAVERVSRKDPFGYIAAVTAARLSVAELLAGPYMSNKQEVERHDKANEFAKSLSANQSLFILVVYQMLADASDSAPKATPAFTVSAQRFIAVLAPTAIESIAAQLPEIAPRLATHDWSVFTEHTGPTILENGLMSDRIRRARGDVRQAMLLLKPFDEVRQSKPSDSTESTREP